MTDEKRSAEKKGGVKTVIILVLILAAITGVIIFELYQFGVLGYEPQYIDLAPDQFGSAKKLEGRVAMVTIFASDKYGKWDFSQEQSVEARRHFLDCTKVAAEWIEAQGKRYDKEIEVCYAADENDDLLYYEYDFGDFGLFENAGKKIRECRAENEWKYIESSLDSENIKKKLGCESIVYCFYTNYDGSTDSGSYQIQVKVLPNEKPYECIFIPYLKRGIAADPVLIAHETLHTFGAIDFYGAERGNNTFNIPQEFVDHAAEHYCSDVMYITGGIKDRIRVYDRVDGDISNITAYYLGWLEKAPPEIDWYRMRRSQFDKKPE